MAARTKFLLAVLDWWSRLQRRWRRRHLRAVPGGAPRRARPLAGQIAEPDDAAERAVAHLRVVNAARDS